MQMRFGVKQAMWAIGAAVLLVAASCETGGTKEAGKSEPLINGVWKAPAETPKVAGAWVPAVKMSPVKVEIKKDDAGMRLYRNGKPYFINGGGGTTLHKELAQYGGNSFRTWGVDEQTGPLLDEAEKLGLTVCQGIWVEKATSADAVKNETAKLRETVAKYKDHPAILMWGIGNEMENGNDNEALWKKIETMAKACKEVDPNHPTIVVVAELGGEKVANIHRWAPSIDAVGINSYAGGGSVGKRYKDLATKYFKDNNLPVAVKPYALTEFGPAGQWETQERGAGGQAIKEKTSTEKATSYANTYKGSVIGMPDLALGSYSFLWGFKVEATSTWYGMYLPDGSKVAAVDTMSEFWTGKPVANPCPVVKGPIKLGGADTVNSGETLTATFDVSDPKGGALKYEWQFLKEVADYNAQDPGNKAGADFTKMIVENGKPTVTVKAPAVNGVYRLYAYARNETGGAALASAPVLVKGGEEPPFKAPMAKLPYVFHGVDAGNKFIPSGYAGDYAFVKMDGKFAGNPHGDNKTSIKCDYTVTTGKDGVGYASATPLPESVKALLGSGGVVWQSPVNDWGDKPGGLNFTGAKKLTFWARGEKGGEKVWFGVGYLTADREAGKKYYDSAKVAQEYTLTKDWTEYTVQLGGKDLSLIKSGFFWEARAQKEPVTFYLSDVKVE